jgi:hypothetical protein
LKASAVTSFSKSLKTSPHRTMCAASTATLGGGHPSVWREQKTLSVCPRVASGRHRIWHSGR